MAKKSTPAATAPVTDTTPAAPTEKASKGKKGKKAPETQGTIPAVTEATNTAQQAAPVEAPPVMTVAEAIAAARADLAAKAAARNVGAGLGLTEATEVKFYRINVKSIVVPGIDYPADMADPLYDTRVHNPLDPEMTMDIVNNGVRLPVEVVMRGDEFVLSDGRRRIMHGREAELISGHAVDVTFSIVDEKSPAETFLAVRRANAFRVNDDALTLALNCVRARDTFGISIADYARAEGVSDHDMRQKLALTRLAPELIALLKSGDLSHSHGIQLAKCGDLKAHPAGDFAAQLRVYKKLTGAKSLTTQNIRREKGDGPDPDDDGAEGTAATGETAGETSGEGDEAPAKKEREPRAGYVMSDIKKLVKLWDSQDPCDVADEVVEFARCMSTGTGARKVKGLQASLKKIQG